MCFIPRNENKRWVKVPKYVELIESHPEIPAWLIGTLAEIKDEEFERWEAQDGEFYCTYCGLWRDASQVDPVPGFLNFFVCRHRHLCEACLRYPENPERFMKRGWYPAARKLQFRK